MRGYNNCDLKEPRQISFWHYKRNGLTLMSDKKQFAVVMLVSALFVTWILYRSLNVVVLNEQLAEDPELKNYPYQFRVLNTEGRVAIMSTLRSHEVPAVVALRVLYPELQELPADNPKVIKAERDMARMQARAQKLVLDYGKFDAVRWELDENWLRLHRAHDQVYSRTALSER